ncbi:MAG: hypothetical protein ACYTG2_09405 [Planctomycetota bacterium]|jgi:hypothetical protein
MSVILWSALAIGLTFVAVLVAAYHARSIAPPLEMPLGETMPTAPLQRLVRWSLVLGPLPLLAAAGVVWWFGPAAYDQDVTARLSVTGLLLLSMCTLVTPHLFAGIWCTRDSGKMDERDRSILSRAPAGQAAAMMVLLAVWMVALQESFRGEPGIPGVFLHLMFWSCLLVGLMGSHVGMLIAYRRS